MDTPLGIIARRGVSTIGEVHGFDDLVGFGEAHLFGGGVAGDEQPVSDEPGPAAVASSHKELPSDRDAQHAELVAWDAEHFG